MRKKMQGVIVIIGFSFLSSSVYATQEQKEFPDCLGQFTTQEQRCACISENTVAQCIIDRSYMDDEYCVLYTNPDMIERTDFVKERCEEINAHPVQCRPTVGYYQVHCLK